jgi:hypothetical protein
MTGTGGPAFQSANDGRKTDPRIAQNEKGLVPSLIWALSLAASSESRNGRGLLDRGLLSY